MLSAPTTTKVPGFVGPGCDMQTRLGSLLEAWSNTLLGFAVNVLAAPFIYPLFGATFTFAQNIGIVLIFTAISVARSYVVRRWFNNRVAPQCPPEADSASAS